MKTLIFKMEGIGMMKNNQKAPTFRPCFPFQLISAIHWLLKYFVLRVDWLKAQAKVHSFCRNWLGKATDWVMHE